MSGSRRPEIPAGWMAFLAGLAAALPAGLACWSWGPQPPAAGPGALTLAVACAAAGAAAAVAAVVATRGTRRRDEDARAGWAETERLLRESERKYRIVADRTYDWEFWLGPGGRFLYCSPSCERVTGRPAAEFLEDPGLLDRIVHPDDLSRVQERREADLRCGPTGEFRDTSELEFRVVRPDGSVRWLGHVASAVYREDGTFLGLRGSNRDVTERKSAEEALRESEDTFRYVFERSSVARSLTTPAGAIRGNRALAELLGCSSLDEVARLTWRDVTHPDDAAATEQALASLLSGERESVRLVERYLRRDGQEVWGDLSTALRRAPDGTPLYFISTLVDVTERVRAEQEVVRLNRRLEKAVAERTAALDRAVHETEAFSYTVAHDLRTPLRAIHGYSVLLAERSAGRLDAEGDRLLATIEASARRMGVMIDDLLDFYRTGRRELARAPVDMTSLAREALDCAIPRAERDRFEVRLEELPPARGDGELVAVLLLQLVANSVKFSLVRERPVVEIGSCPTLDGPEYFVRDNGIGFDPRYAEKIFGVFERLHRVDSFTGTGIGLALVRRIVERHGGTVRAEGELDRGATFRFTLGRGAEPAPGDPPPAAGDGPGAPGG